MNHNKKQSDKKLHIRTKWDVDVVFLFIYIQGLSDPGAMQFWGIFETYLDNIKQFWCRFHALFEKLEATLKKAILKSFKSCYLLLAKVKICAPFEKCVCKMVVSG